MRCRYSLLRIKLLDNKRTVSQLAGLERRTNSFGKDKIDHGPNGMDDNANVVCGSLVASQVREPEIPIVAPIIVSLHEPIVPGQSATAAFYEYYGGNAHCWN
jgi:hypothetical protein